MPVPYEKLALNVPIVASVVCETPYSGRELRWSYDSELVRDIEARRRSLTHFQRAEFVTLVDERCRQAYKSGGEWFARCARAKTNRGRDRLYAFVTHWLVAYLLNPESLRRTAFKAAPGSRT